MRKIRMQRALSIQRTMAFPRPSGGLLRLSGPDSLLRRRRGCRGPESHLHLELLHQLARPELLRFLLDLDLLLVDVPQRHLEARLADRRLLLDLADHLVVRLADARDLELLHGVGDLLLPLRPAVVPDRADGL